ncbi:hypothetical protein PSTG_17467, partial [Puccinia striiformis f. sp. tritici PST-78]
MVLVTLAKNKECLGDELLELPAAKINQIVEEVYETFCSTGALQLERAAKFPAWGNMIRQTRDFATIIEASRAMKSGDPGRLMYIWERWAVMIQALPHMPHYSEALPQLVLLLKEVLPRSMALVVKSTLLICPSGRANHFMATDCYLELQNYWLKYFFNHSGIGTDINQLKDVFSINIPV